MDVFWKVAVSVAGLGAVASFVLWSLYRQWLKLPIFQQMTKKQQFTLFLVFFFLTFMFGVSGLVTYAYTTTVAAKVELPFVPKMTTAQRRALSITLEEIRQTFTDQRWDDLIKFFDPAAVEFQANLGIGQQQLILEAFELRSTQVALPDTGGAFGQLNSIQEFELVGQDASEPGAVVVSFKVTTLDGVQRTGEFTVMQHQDGVWRIFFALG